MTDYYIEVHAEDWPREVGPFGSREAAARWMEGRTLTGNYLIVPLTHPFEVNHLGRP